MKVTIDGQSIEVEPGTTILQAARMIGGESVPPAMCYYSKLKGSGGKCRCCLVEVSKGSEADPRPMPKLMASCVTGVMDGMEVNSISSQRVLDARKSVTEFLLINHPLDCPVCDQAGECDLQNLSFKHGTGKTRFIEEKRTFEPENIGDKIQLHMNRCILCYRCVMVADQLTDNRVHGVMNRGDHSQISTCISKAIDNEFSGNMIDVCPVGALTDKTFRFKQRVWFNKPFNAHRDCDKCCGKTTLWMFGDEIQRVTARKDEYHEVEDFICNECRFEHKNPADWVIEGPRKFEKDSVINQNNYTRKLEKVTIKTEKNILLGRDQDRNKISMPDVPLTEQGKKKLKEGNV
ncbi:2Fe-2S iron-sulfur cluster binding domain-containing protein [Flavobacterium salilacus subsp. salilacus]|uniref:2Fe-2S iron-sulfur cluster-binding protein n=1 Tax=Flavobacterium TaxID=237 RepID=UPI001074B1C2|nr:MULTISPECIES: 2Fe-2S iron-sulfur cluster-binding protein [Flavobacterium]KAF2520176.1 2Fe-2S iron-sulfur cluster binding domain-containing protein [Flavobacterium salilacus subsp. salilacus]MBE1613908.1 (2Fe-2S)-binding protein [Flavobacterium sp. SaA2.13]